MNTALINLSADGTLIRATCSLCGQSMTRDTAEHPVSLYDLEDAMGGHLRADHPEAD